MASGCCDPLAAALSCRCALPEGLVRPAVAAQEGQQRGQVVHLARVPPEDLLSGELEG